MPPALSSPGRPTRLRLLLGGALIALLYSGARLLGSVVPLPVPVSILALLALLLLLRWSAVERLVTPAATLLIGLLGALLVPPLIGVLLVPLRWSLSDVASIALLLAATTLMTGLATALLARWLLRP